MENVNYLILFALIYMPFESVFICWANEHALVAHLDVTDTLFTQFNIM